MISSCQCNNARLTVAGQQSPACFLQADVSREEEEEEEEQEQEEKATKRKTSIIHKN
jgi:hypothetical protein